MYVYDALKRHNRYQYCVNNAPRYTYFNKIDACAHFPYYDGAASIPPFTDDVASSSWHDDEMGCDIFYYKAYDRKLVFPDGLEVQYKHMTDWYYIYQDKVLAEMYIGEYGFWGDHKYRYFNVEDDGQEQY